MPNLDNLSYYPATSIEKLDENSREKIRKKHKLVESVGSGIVSTGVLGSFLLMKDPTNENEIKTIADKMIKKHDLTKKGFSFHFVDLNLKDNKNTNNILQIADDMAGKITSKLPFLKKVKTGIKIMYAKALAIVGLGLNAFYEPVSNIAAAPKKKPSLMVHEIGHAINANAAKFMKPLQYATRVLPAAAAPLLLVNALSNDLNSNEKNPTFGKKVKNFFEKNAAELTLLSFIPLVTEEALASHHGLKYSKGILNKVKLNSCKKFLRLGLLSYIGTGLTATLAMRMAEQEKKKIMQN